VAVVCDGRLTRLVRATGGGGRSLSLFDLPAKRSPSWHVARAAFLAYVSSIGTSRGFEFGWWRAGGIDGKNMARWTQASHDCIFAEKGQTGFC